MLEKMRTAEKYLKIQGTQYRIECDYRTSFSRHGRFARGNIDAALNSAIHFVQENSPEGRFACVDILLYKMTKDGWWLVESASITSKFSGEYYENGYAKPVRSDEYEVKEW